MPYRRRRIWIAHLPVGTRPLHTLAGLFVGYRALSSARICYFGAPLPLPSVRIEREYE